MFSQMLRAVRASLFTSRPAVRPPMRRRPLTVGNLEERLVPAAVFPAHFYSPYVNTLVDTNYDYAGAAQQAGVRTLTLGFIDGDANGNPGWDGQVPFGSVGDQQIRTNIQNLRNQGGDVMLSFGGDTEGSSAEELAVAITDVNQLQQTYQSVIDSLGVTHVDFDIEGNKMMSDLASINRRSQAMAGLERAGAAAGRELDVYLTLPCGPDGQGGFSLGADALNVVDSALANGVTLAGVNLMTMDYSDGRIYDGVHAPTMGDAAISAAQGLFAQLKSELTQYGIQKTDGQIWQMIGITPQIGINATNNDGGQEIFTLDDAHKVEAFAAQQGIGRIGIWTVNRDQNPNNNLVNLTETDSGVTQQPYDFSHIFNQIDNDGQPMPVAPPAPDGLAATTDEVNQQIVITWNAVAGATSYNVYRGTASGAETLLWYGQQVKGTTFYDTGVTPGQTYYYYVTAVNAGGESVASNEITATLAQQLPAAPIALQGMVVNGQVQLTWFWADNVVSWNIYRSNTSGSEQYLDNSVNNSYTDANVTPGMTYYYTVTAVNALGESLFSNEFAVTIF